MLARFNVIYMLYSSKGPLIMSSILSSRLVQSCFNGLGYCVSALQRLLMRAAVFISLKLCLFTVRVLLNSTGRNQTGSAA